MIGQVIEVADKVLGKFIPDKNLKMKLQKEMTMAFHDANLAQIQLNKQEAAHKNIFVAGWRPFVGWTCGVALAYHFILEPVIVFVLALYNIQLTLPQFDMASLLTVLMGMLGLGGLRTYEKMKGVSREK